MSFLSKLELDGNTYNILECKYNFIQPVDGTGKPKGMPKGGDIIIKIESTGNPELLGWMLDHNQMKNGKITFYRRDAMSKLQELNFEKAYCIEFTECFNGLDSHANKQNIKNTNHNCIAFTDNQIKKITKQT